MRRQGGGKYEPALWPRLDALVDSAESVEDLLHHRLGPWAGRRYRETGRPLPRPIQVEERYAGFATLAARMVLGRVADVYDGTIVVLKGPEAAARYPDPQLRPLHDLDLLVDDAPAAHARLLAAGCQVQHERLSPHHELPLAFPDVPLTIELHHAPKWLPWSAPPAPAELLAAAAPSPLFDGTTLALPAAHQAVLMAVHSWAHRPLSRLLDLADVELLRREAEPGAAAALAARWGVSRVWEATVAASAALFDDTAAPWTLRTWARSTPAVRRRSRPEDLLEKSLAPFAAAPPARAARIALAGVGAMVGDRMRRRDLRRPRESHLDHPAITLAAAAPDGDPNWS